MFNYFNSNNDGAHMQENNLSQENFATLQKARKDLVGEIQAIIEYDDHIKTSSNKTANATWESIRNEELVHVGELLSLINYLAPYQKQFIDKGAEEFGEIVSK